MKKFSREFYEKIYQVNNPHRDLEREYDVVKGRLFKELTGGGIEQIMPSKRDKTTFKCCRLKYLHPAYKIATAFLAHQQKWFQMKATGQPLLWNNTMPGDRDLGIPPEPRHGWLLDRKDEGYPCDALGPDGCTFGEEEKPHRCKNHPAFEDDLHLIMTCSITHDEKGDHIGVCDGCGRF